MIAVDTNVLVYADRKDVPKHAAALHQLRTLAEGDAAWAIPVFCLGEFLRLVTNPRFFTRPTPVPDAVAAMEALLASPSARLLCPGEAYWPLLQEMIRDGGVSGNHVFDAQIAAVCLEHGAKVLLTEDRDFTRFPGIEVRLLGAP